MTPITRWFLKAGLIWLLAASIVMVVTAVHFPEHARAAKLVSWHMLVMGWLTQTIIGVSIWMFPRSAGGERNRENWRNSVLFVLLNGGLLLRFLTEPLLDSGYGTVGTGVRIVAAVSVFMQLGAVGIYLTEIWPRIRSRAKRVREG